jgi:outer membrane receptor protein involved in Fe transport
MSYRPCVCAWLRWSCVLIVFGVIAGALAARETVAFDVPAGRAADTLRIAAAQADVAFIYTAQTVGEVRTLAVRGELAPLAAFRQMLAGTPLTVIWHEQSGTFVIKEISEHQTSNPELEKMKTSTRGASAPAQTGLWRKFLLGALIGTATLAEAQTVANPAPTPTPREEVIELSPFVVTASEDTGYRATATAAGSRLKTDLKDVAASLTVLTNDFMDDLGANNLADALSMVANADTDLTTDTSDTTSGGEGYVTNNRNQREGEVRVRGLGAAATTMNFILIDSSPDRYNIERAELLRGANSILFGLGQAAGIINYTPKKARLNWQITELGFKTDNYGSLRNTIDIGRTLVKDKLAFRVNNLISDDRSMYESSYWKDKRSFFTAKYRPLRNTTFDVGYEMIESHGRKPNYALLQDNVSEWIREHNSAHQRFSGAELQSFLNRNLYWDSFAQSVGNASGNVFGSPDLLFDAGGVLTSAQPGLYRRGLDAGATDHLVFFAPENPGVIIDNTMFRATAREPNGTTQPSTGPASAPATLRVSQRRNYAQSGSPKDGVNRAFTDPQVVDAGIFPFLDYDIPSLPGNFRTIDDQKFFITVDQKVTSDLYFQATFQKEKYKVYNRDALTAATRQINLDINPLLLDGRANPNFLRPFISGRQLERYEDRRNDNLVLQGSYEFDFARKTRNNPWLNWLGYHRLAGLYSSTESNRLFYQKEPAIISNIPNVLTMAQDNSNTLRRVRQAYYIGDAVRPGDTGLRFTGMPSSLGFDFAKLGAAKLNYYEPPVGNPPNTPILWKTYSGGMEMGNVVGANSTYESIEADGMGFSLQSFFWKRRLVTLVGIRRDNFDQFEHTAIDSATYAARNGITTDIAAKYWQNALQNRDDYILSSEPVTSYRNVETKTGSVVFHVNDAIRVFANKSENFALSTPRRDNLYRPIAPQTGKTEEYGVGFTLLKDKLYLNVSAYHSQQLNADSATGRAAIGSIRNVENRLFAAMLGAGYLTGNPSLDDPLTPQIESYNVKGFTFLERQLDGSVIEKPAYFDANGTAVGQYETPENVSATESTDSKGFEVETTFNPTRSLRIQFSVSRLKNTVTDIGPEVRDYLAFRAPLYMQAAWLSLREDNTWGAAARARTALATGGPLISKRFNDLVASNYLTGIDRIGRSNPGISEYSARMTANYTFREGWLKGFAVGTNLRWESGKAIGYYLKQTSFTLYDFLNAEDKARIGDLSNLSDPDPAKNFDDNLPFQVPDIDRLIEGEPILTGGAMAAYRRKIFKGKVAWTVQLNVQNILRQGGDLRVIRVNPDDSKIYGINEPTTYQLTNTLSF